MILRQPQPRLIKPLTQVRHATYIPRPRRPYTFTQLVALSDGSTFLQRTTSPAPVYRAIKDVRNSALWNPSSQRLANVEDDEAGKLARFRERFGRGWDAAGAQDAQLDEMAERQRVVEERAMKGQAEGEKTPFESKTRAEQVEEVGREGMESLMDLISAAGGGVKKKKKAAGKK